MASLRLSLRSTEFSLVGPEYRRHLVKPAKQSSFILLHSLNPFLSAYLLVCNNRVIDITMSFGFSVGDFVTVLQLTNTIRERFVGAPEQFKAISNE